MATKKSPVPQGEEQLLEQPAEEAQQEAGGDAQLKAQEKEIERLRAQIAQMKRRPAQNDAEVVKEATRQAAESGVDPWTVTVNIRSPRRPGREDPWYWLSVNGKSVQIPADDRRYDVKLPWAEALMNSLEAERYAAEFQDNIEVFDPVTNPHK